MTPEEAADPGTAQLPDGTQAADDTVAEAQNAAEAGAATAAQATGTSAADDTGQAGDGPRAQILASGVALRWAVQAQRLLADDWGVLAYAWSATSWTELRRDALACDEWNLLHPDEEQRVPYVTQALDGHQGPVVAVSDWIRAVPDQIARWVPAPFLPLGTDGFGRSDTREALRRFFETDGRKTDALGNDWEKSWGGAAKV